MKNCGLILGVVVGLVATGVLAEDIKTLSGREFHNVQILSFDMSGYTISCDEGAEVVPFADVNAELRGHYKALSLLPLPTHMLAREREDSAGPNDLLTIPTKIFRNYTIREMHDERFLITHDTGLDWISFVSVPMDKREVYRSQTTIVPLPPITEKDLVTGYGQRFRNIDVTLHEPDGLTFTHDGGKTKIGFLALREETRKQYNYNQMEGWKYAREQSVKKVHAEKAAAAAVAAAAAAAAEPQSSGPVLVEVRELSLDELPDDTYRVSFVLSNITPMPQTYTATVRDESRASLINRIVEVPAKSGTKLLQIEVPSLKPATLLVTSGTFRTNVVLNWSAAAVWSSPN